MARLPLVTIAPGAGLVMVTVGGVVSAARAATEIRMENVAKQRSVSATRVGWLGDQTMAFIKRVLLNET